MRQPSPPLTALALGFAVLLLAGGSAAGRPAPLPKIKTLRTPGRIEALAMDGSRVAYDVAGSYGSRTRCNAVYVWNVARKNSITRVSSRPTCAADNTSTGAGVRELALAGGRAAWIVNQGGNSESSDSLYVSDVSHRGERLIASAFRSGDVSGILTGNWLGGLVGAGTFLALDHWATDSSGNVTSAKLRRIRTRLADLAEGAGTMTARSTDGRQVAVLRSDETVGLYSTHGKLLRTVRPNSAVEVALRGDYLLVLTKSGTVDVSTRTPAGSCARGALPRAPRGSTSPPGWRPTRRLARARGAPRDREERVRHRRSSAGLGRPARAGRAGLRLWARRPAREDRLRAAQAPAA